MEPRPVSRRAYLLPVRHNRNFRLLTSEVSGSRILENTLPQRANRRWSAGPALLRESRQSFVRSDRRVLKLPRLLTSRWCSPPLKLPGESPRKGPGDDAHGVLGEFGISLGGLLESKAVQLRVDLNRLHANIIPSRVRAASPPYPVRDNSRTAFLRHCYGWATIHRKAFAAHFCYTQEPKRTGSVHASDLHTS